MAERRIVRESHNASYADPIAVGAGEPLTLTGREDDWDGHRWLWAVAPDGREGWVPDDLAVGQGDGHVAARDYTAIELTCTAGEVVDVVRESHGWAWCRAQDGREGWVPRRNLSDD